MAGHLRKTKHSKKHLIHSTPQNLVFGVFTSNEIKKLSVVKVSTPLTFTPLGHTLAGGLYDPAMGSCQSTICSTCTGNSMKCNGHMGHIDLPLPVINPIFHSTVISVLSSSCLSCHKILLPEPRKLLLITQIQLLDEGYVPEALDIEQTFIQVASVSDGLDEAAIVALLSRKFNKAKGKLVKDKVRTFDEWKYGEVLRSQFIHNIKQYIHKGNNCPKCKEPWRKLKSQKNKIMIEAKLEGKKFKDKSQKKSKEELKLPPMREGGLTQLLPSESMTHLRQIWENEENFMKEIVPVLKTVAEPNPTDLFFINVIPVTPINTRPMNIVDGTVTEHPQNYVYKNILQDCLVIRSIIHLINKGKDDQQREVESELSSKRLQIINELKGSDLPEKLHLAWQDLQKNCDFLLDKNMAVGNQSQSDGQGLKQLLEKKEGIIRMHMMGKRVNFAARSVITPDPNLNVDEIGIPDVFAKKLTYPVPVNDCNIVELRKMIINGPDVHPGAVMIENENGFITKIPADNPTAREGIAKRLLTQEEGGSSKGVKIVYRHLLNGDILLLNRQPTLHRPSIMGHKARILKGDRTLRLHYANCKAYNADFDGDEMNAHFPQSELGRSEAYNLVSVCKQYLVPKDGTPLSGLIQDHVVSGVRLTMRGSFFPRQDYMNLVFQALSYKKGEIKVLPPAIIKPIPLWSGKQIVSTVIINLIPEGKVPLNLSSSSKISYKAWVKGNSRPSDWGGTLFVEPETMTEAEVVIRGGELLSGVLDKTHYGATPYSLIHCMYELYGGNVSSQLLSSFAKLFTGYLQLEGFTLGVEDILLVKKADKERSKYIKSVRNVGKEIAANVLDLTDDSSLQEIKDKLESSFRKDPKFRGLLDYQYKKCLDTYTNNINKVCLGSGLLQSFPANNLQLMVQSGAKGSTVNTMQISCLLGQIELEGKRPPIMLSGRSLPSFPPYEVSPRAGGFIDGRFMTGIKPQEFFFHCMAGREGLIDTAVKTSRSGYLQRCLVKHLEGLSVMYDLSVRDSDDSVIQFRYGEDAMEVSKAQFLNEQQIPFLVDNIANVLDKSIVEQLKTQNYDDLIKNHCKKMKAWRKKPQNNLKRTTGFTLYAEDVSVQLSEKSKKKMRNGRSKTTRKICKMWHDLTQEERIWYEKKAVRCPDPLSSQCQPDCAHVLCEKLDSIIENYLTENNITGPHREDVMDMIGLKASLSVCPPGEPVGLLAAQSVGEPSTQMTLNTFHFAGRGEMNVTLGIPRLREILMVASKNIKTPSMEVPFHQNLRRIDKKAEQLRKSMTRVTLADMLEYIEVNEHLDYESVYRNYTYRLHFQFLPRQAYKHDCDVRPKQVLRHVETEFITELLCIVHRRTRLKKEVITSEAEKEATGRSRKSRDNEEEDQDLDAKEPELGGVRGKEADDSSDEELVADDEDATAERRRARQQEEQEYQDPEEGEVLSDDEEEREDQAGVGEDEWEDRRNEVLQSHNCVNKYRFDTEEELWCEVTLCLPIRLGRVDLSNILKDLASKSVVSQVKGIRRAFTSKIGGGMLLKTDGLNLSEVFRHRHLLDINRLYSNDIHAVANTYGIEAAARVIVKEVQNVFKVYGITVDPRHLLLIADYMTYDGRFQPLNRSGIEGSTSPLQQMSFESSLRYLKNAVVGRRNDRLHSASARIMTGLPIKCGTASFGLLHRLALSTTN